MKTETLKKLCCPFDKADVELQVITKDAQKNITEGILVCTDCKRVYPIVSGIPIMNPDEYRDFELEKPLLKKWEQLLIEDSGQQLKVKKGRLIESDQ